MDRLTCADCHTGIPNGEALIRSRSLVQLAFHRACYHPAPVVVPAQRVPWHDFEFAAGRPPVGGRPEDVEKGRPRPV